MAISENERYEWNVERLLAINEATTLDAGFFAVLEFYPNVVGGGNMPYLYLGRRFRKGNPSNRHRLQSAATRNRQRIIQRVWSFESLEDRALLAALSGLHNIGPTGDFSSITAAISSIQTNGLDGPLVLELQPTYTSTGEVFPVNFRNLGSTAVNTITLRPELGATNLLIESATTTLNISGTQFLTIDGRPGGIGTSKELMISSTGPTSFALSMANEASNNIFQYLTFRGVNISNTGGVIYVGSTMGPQGNDNNTFNHCDITSGATPAVNGIYAIGKFDSPPQYNTNNTISNCNIFDFYYQSGSSSQSGSGVRINSGNSDWTITGNSFYQTRIFSANANSPSVRPIWISNPTANQFVVTNNVIGGSAPNAGGTPWTTNGTFFDSFVGIYLYVGNVTPTSVQGNVIKNFAWGGNNPSSTASYLWTGIYVQAGSVNIGTAQGNTIGSNSGNGSISLTTNSLGGGSAFGIRSLSPDTVTIVNNAIGSMSASGSPTVSSMSITGVSVSGGVNIISNNLIGSLTTPNSLYAVSDSGSTSNSSVSGITSTNATATTVTRNTIANLTLSFAFGGDNVASIRGISSTTGVNILSENTVFNLKTTSQNPSPIGSVSIIGIETRIPTASQTVSKNIVHSIVENSGAAQNSVTGISYASPTSGSNVIERNFVHSFSVSSPTTSSSVTGLRFGAGSFIAQNNMVRLGLDASGASTAGSSTVRGISDAGTTDGRFFYHNSVYIGGTQTSGTNHSYALSGTTGVSNVRGYRNNIFVNARSSDPSATGKHYAVAYGGTTVNPTGLSANGNLFFVSGTNGILGSFNSADVATLVDHQSLTGQDASSIFTDPLFMNATGDISALNLHIQSVSPAQNAGVPLSSVTIDFDGDLRSLTSPEIGADERDTTSPMITGVYVVGSIWSSQMVDAVDGGGVGTGNGLGYELTPGLTLPNAGIDRIYVQFNEPVVGFDASTVALLGVDVANYAGVPGMMSVSYDAANRRGLIQLSSSLVRDKLRLGVSDAVRDGSMNALDGDANAAAGGVFDLRFNVLIGDANNDGSVNGGDLPFFANAFNTSAGNLQYNSRTDWDANGSVNGGDLPAFAMRFNQSLPNAEPGALGFLPFMLSSPDFEGMLAPPVEEIEEIFSQLDDEEYFLELENKGESW